MVSAGVIATAAPAATAAAATAATTTACSSSSPATSATKTTPTSTTDGSASCSDSESLSATSTTRMPQHHQQLQLQLQQKPPFAVQVQVPLSSSSSLKVGGIIEETDTTASATTPLPNDPFLNNDTSPSCAAEVVMNGHHHHHPDEPQHSIAAAPPPAPPPAVDNDSQHNSTELTDDTAFQAAAVSAVTAESMDDHDNSSSINIEGTATTITTSTTKSELDKIITEIASTGTCSWLPWNTAPPSLVSAPCAKQEPLQSDAQDHSSSFSGKNGVIIHPRKPVVHDPTTACSNDDYAHCPSSVRVNASNSSIPSSAAAVVTTNTSTTTPNSRKRSLFHMRAASVGVSESSTETAVHNIKKSKMIVRANSAPTTTTATTTTTAIHSAAGSTDTASYTSQRHALWTAMRQVLDDYFNNKGGYTMSLAEKLKYRLDVNVENENHDDCDKKNKTQEDEEKEERMLIHSWAAFEQRRNRILSILDPSIKTPQSPFLSCSGGAAATVNENDYTSVAPPFTIQRVAEVLVDPERYYKQTHKLCNALEKLLCVTSSVAMYGGHSGGVTSLTLQEDQELAALAEERKRFQLDLRQRRSRQHGISRSSSEDAAEGVSIGDKGHQQHQNHDRTDSRFENWDPSSPIDGVDASEDDDDAASSEIMEAAARASLRTKFDHVGIDPVVVNLDGRPSSPPLPTLAISAGSPPGYAISSHSGYSPPGLARVQSPVLFGSVDGSPNSSSSPPSIGQKRLLHIHHLNSPPSSSTPPLDFASLHHSTEGNNRLSPLGNHHNMPSSLLLASQHIMPSSREVDLESRSSASSDFDSESDASFDDSASDRSDGSDYLDVVGSAAVALPAVSSSSSSPTTSIAANCTASVPAAASSASAGLAGLTPRMDATLPSSTSPFTIRSPMTLSRLHHPQQQKMVHSYPFLKLSPSSSPPPPPPPPPSSSFSPATTETPPEANLLPVERSAVIGTDNDSNVNVIQSAERIRTTKDDNDNDSVLCGSDLSDSNTASKNA